MATDPRDEDEEALRWGDESDPTHVAAPASVEPADEREAPAGGSAMLVVYGVFGGIFLLYIVGWIIAVRRDTTSLGNAFFDFMYSASGYLAIVGPLAWFLGVFWLAPRRAVPRILWLLLGVVLFVPLPFVFGLGA